MIKSCDFIPAPGAKREKKWINILNPCQNRSHELEILIFLSSIEDKQQKAIFVN